MTLGEFFLKLATDPEFLALYQGDAESALRQAELSDVHRALLLAGDLRELRVKLVAELEVEGERMSIGTVHTITVHAPEPPPPSAE